MSVASTTTKQQFVLDGSTAAFTFTFRALTTSPSDIKCIATVSGSDTTLAYTTDYTVSVNSNGVGGTVTLVNPSAIGSGTLTVYRQTTNIQSSDYDNYNQFPADTLETDLDIRTLVSQEQNETLARTLTLAISSSGVSASLPSPVANYILGWNGTADAIVNYLPNTGAYLSLASQAQAVAGTDNSAYMTALRVAQAITALVGSHTITMTSVALNLAQATNIASGATVNIGAANGNDIHITGVTTITAFDSIQAGVIRTLTFDGSLSLTHNATSLILPGAANIVTAAGDTAVFKSEGSGNWRCIAYQKAGTVPMIIRKSRISIAAGGTPGTNLTITGGENYSLTLTTGTNVGKNGSGGSFALNSAGNLLTVTVTSATAGTVCLATSITYHRVKNASVSAGDIFYVSGAASAGQIGLQIFQTGAAGNAQSDWTAVLTTAADQINIDLLCVTLA